MMIFNSSLANNAMERILELSADAHIERNSAAKDSPEFRILTGVITAYGKVLSLLVEFQRRDEFYTMICGLDLPEPGSELIH